MFERNCKYIFVFGLLGFSVLSLEKATAHPIFDSKPKFRFELPPDTTKTGSLKVSGDAGPKQETGASVYYCVPELFATDQKGACLYSFFVSLNALENRIPIGNVLVEYSNSIYGQPVPIEEGKASILSMVEFEVPEMAGRYKFKLFQDLKNRDEQLKFVKFLWRTSDTSSLEEFCRAPIRMSKAAKRACSAWDGNNYKNLLDTWVQFSDRAEFSIAEFFEDNNYVTGERTLDLRWSDFSRNHIAKGEDGEILSVFPGVYGMELRYESGANVDRYGIDLRKVAANRYELR